MSSASIPIRSPQPPASEVRAASPGAGSDGQPAAPAPDAAPLPGTQLLSELVQKPWTFDFFQAVRRLESLWRNRPPVGQNHRLNDDVVRFGQSPSLAFAGSTLGACAPAKDGRPPRLTVQFFGLCGPWGPLPLHITEYLHQRQKHAADVAGIQFFNLFNHRMTALFYRAWATHQQTVSFERGLAENGGRSEVDRFGIYIASLMGRGMAAFRQRDALPDLAKLSFVGFLANQSKSADGLAALLRGFFEVPVEIEQFVGHWVEIPAESCCRLGESIETCSLGATAIVGNRIWDCQQKFRIRIGPIGFDRYQYFLPGHSGLARLKAAIRNYLGDELDWDVQLVLRADEVPTASLGRIGQLGWTSWMGNSVRQREAENLILNPAA